MILDWPSYKSPTNANKHTGIDFCLKKLFRDNTSSTHSLTFRYRCRPSLGCEPVVNEAACAWFWKSLGQSPAECMPRKCPNGPAPLSSRAKHQVVESPRHTRPTSGACDARIRWAIGQQGTGNHALEAALTTLGRGRRSREPHRAEAVRGRHPRGPHRRAPRPPPEASPTPPRRRRPAPRAAPVPQAAALPCRCGTGS